MVNNRVVEGDLKQKSILRSRLSARVYKLKWEQFEDGRGHSAVPSVNQ